jgi:hypothetical protein
MKIRNNTNYLYLTILRLNFSHLTTCRNLPMPNNMDIRLSNFILNV